MGEKYEYLKKVLDENVQNYSDIYHSDLFNNI